MEQATEPGASVPESEKSLYLNRTILESISDIFISVDNDFNLIYINHQAEGFVGKKGEDILGKNLWLAMEKYKNTSLFTYLAEAMQNKKFSDFEFDTGKEWYYFRIYSSQEGLSVYANNITERKQLEEYHKRNEETFKLLVQNGFDIITTFSEDGTITYQSESIEPILGYTPEERTGINIFKDSFVHPDDYYLQQEMLQSVLTNSNKVTRGEFRIRHKNGSYKIIECVFRNLLGHPHIHAIIANYRDITERKALEKQKDNFIMAASHELKTPITTIKAYAEILHEIFIHTKDAESANMVRKMESQVDRLTKVVKDLLDVAKIEEGQLKLVEGEYDINEVIADAVEDLQRTTPVALVTQLQPAKKLWGDKNRVEQVLVNLVSNAIKYSHDGKEIIIRSRTDDEGVTVEVQDFGIGMTEEAQLKAFQRFYRPSDPEAKTYPGLGIGLYLSSEIIKRHKGRIWVNSEKNKGSLFAFSLPNKR
jgi:PAS domain S-box-containing protein